VGTYPVMGAYYMSSRFSLKWK